MPIDIYFTPVEATPPITLAEAQKRFADAGIPCSVEPDEDSPEMYWLVFEPHATCILASVEDGILVFVTVQVSFEEEPDFVDQIGRVMEDMGFDAGDPDQY